MKLLKDFSGGIAYGEINEKDCLAICLFDFFSGGVFIYKTREVTVYIFITLFLLVIVWKRDAPSIMLLREILYS